MSYTNTYYMRPFNESANTLFTYDQRTMLNNYLNMYNSTIDEIRYLNHYLNEVRTHIDYIYFQSNIDITNSETAINRNHTRLRQRQPRHNIAPYIDIRRTNRSIRNQDNISNTIENFLLPIPIIPTQTQIETATTLVRFGNIQNPVNSICPITREPFDPEDQVTQIIYCSHLFNTPSIITWFNSRCICPVCRYDIRLYRTQPPLLETLTTENTHMVQSQIEPITTNDLYISQQSQPVRIRDTSNNIINSQHAREYITEFETNLLRNYTNSRSFDVSNNLIIFEAVITSNPENNTSSRNRNRNRNRHRHRRM